LRGLSQRGIHKCGLRIHVPRPSTDTRSWVQSSPEATGASYCPATPWRSSSPSGLFTTGVSMPQTTASAKAFATP
jgi:hypothetical protein